MNYSESEPLIAYIGFIDNNPETCLYKWFIYKDNRYLHSDGTWHSTRLPNETGLYNSREEALDVIHKYSR